MKIKYDFISNSSSTSFIYISEKELNREEFLEAIGISIDSPLIKIFEHIFNVFEDKLTSGREILNENDLSKYTYTTETINKVKTSLQQGKKVIECRLNSSGDIAESYLCMEFFEIESDDFYINAFNNYW